MGILGGIVSALVSVGKGIVWVFKQLYGTVKPLKYEVVDEKPPVDTGPSDSVRLDELRAIDKREGGSGRN